MIIRSIFDSHPGPAHLSVSKALVSCNLIPVPHSQSVVASAKILGDVVFNIENKGGFCRNVSRMPSKHNS